MKINHQIVSLLGAVLILYTSTAAAFTCQLEIKKSNCWPSTDLQVDMVDASSLKVLKSYQLDKKTAYLSKVFDCNLDADIRFIATFSPPVWPADKGKKYHSQNLYTVPKSLSGGANKWVLQICFANDFSSVPLPMSGDVSNCQCQFPVTNDLKPVGE